MDERYRSLCKKLPTLSDLEEGRRDLAGVLSQAASIGQETLNVDLVYAAVAADGLSLVSVAEAGGKLVRADPWEGPGRLGKAVVQNREVRSWQLGDEAQPTKLDFLDFAGAGAWLGIPIPMADRPCGLLVALREKPDPFSDEDQDLLHIIAEAGSAAIANVRVFHEVESLAVTDELTLVYNYRFLKAALSREVERASRYGQVFSILMLDVDHLKRFNNKHGHLQGSELLRRLAGILSRSSRAIDLVAKYGGDEFLIILPQTRTDGAQAMASRICRAVAEHEFAFCRPGDITISIGVASFPQHGATMEALLAAADEALFQAKRSGRNCSISAQGPGQPGRIPGAA